MIVEQSNFEQFTPTPAVMLLRQNDMFFGQKNNVRGPQQVTCFKSDFGAIQKIRVNFLDISLNFNYL